MKIQLKKCSKCGVEKDVIEFHKGRADCKECFRIRQRKYYQNNKETANRKNKEWQENNSEYHKKYKKEYYKKNKKQLMQKRKERRKILRKDPYYNFTHNLRNRIYEAFKTQSKNGKTKACAEYGIDFGAIYSKIGQKPSGNYHLDHIIPISVFNLDNPEHVRLSHLPENLRWLPGPENLSKHDLIDIEIISCSLKLLSIAKQIGLI